MRTHKMLRDAAIALAIQKGFDAVTVNEVAELAMVNIKRSGGAQARRAGCESGEAV